MNENGNENSENEPHFSSHLQNDEKQWRISFMNQNIYSSHRECTMLYTIYVQVHEINALITIAICGMYVLGSLFIAIKCIALQFAFIALYNVCKNPFQMRTTNNFIKRSKIIISGFKVCQMPD